MSTKNKYILHFKKLNMELPFDPAIPLLLYTWKNWKQGAKEVGEGNGTPLQYSCLENPTDGGAWWAAVHGVAKSRTQLKDFTFIFHFHALEQEIAAHTSVLAWRIPGTGEPGGLPSMGLHRVGHDWSDLAAAAAKQVLIHQSYSSSIHKQKETIQVSINKWVG